MQSFIKSNSVDKDLCCERIYNTHIAGASDYLVSCEEAAKVLSAYIPVECYTNFRDALFHFRKMVQSYEETELERQAFAVAEHSNRAKTDATVSILDCCSNILQILLKEYREDTEIRKSIIHMQNLLNRSVLNLRLSGIMLAHSNVLRPTDDQVLRLIYDFNEFIRTQIGNEKFKYALTVLNKSKDTR